MQVMVWWWCPSSAGTGFLVFHPRAFVHSLSRNEMNLLLDDIPKRLMNKWGERGSLLLLQQYGSSSVIILNKAGEAVSMDTVWTVGSSAENDLELVKSKGIDTKTHTYPFKCKVIPLSRLIKNNCDPKSEECQTIVASSVM